MSSHSMRTELAKVRGLGSAHHGIHHWWMQRLTALALLPLTVWFVYITMSIAAGSADAQTALMEARMTLAEPLNLLCAALFIFCTFHHLQLGLQVVIEDYVPNNTAKITSLILMKFVSFTFAAASLLSLLLIAL